MAEPAPVIREVKDVQEVRFVDLDERALARWRSLLEQTPLLAQRPAQPEILWRLGLAFLGASMLVLGYRSTSIDYVIASPLSCGLGAALSVLVLHRVEYEHRVRRARFPVGRFLFRWGYAEVDVDRLHFVPSEHLRASVSIGALTRSGGHPIVVRLSARAFATRFRFIGLELDVPPLEHLRRDHFAPRGLYRDDPRAAPSTQRRGWVWPLAVGRWALALTGALLAAGCAMHVQGHHAVREARRGYSPYEIWIELEQLHPLPWVRQQAARERRALVARARSRIATELRTPYRDAMQALTEDPWPFVRVSTCVLQRATLGGVPRVTVGPVWTSGPPLTDYFEYAHPWGRWPLRASLAASCRIERDGPVFRVLGTWRFEIDGEVRFERTAVIDAELIAEVTDCGGVAQDRTAAELRAAAGLLSAALRRDVYAVPPADWDALEELSRLERLRGCVSAAAHRVAISDGAR